MDFLINYGVDILLLIVLVSSIVDAYRRGFLKCILSLVCVAISLYAALNYSQQAAEWSYDYLLEDRIVSEVEQAINDGFSSQTAADTVMQTIEMIPDVLLEQLSAFDIDIDAVSNQIASLKLSSHDTAEKISVQIIRPGSLVLLKLLCYILIFAVVRFVSGSVIGLIAKLPMPALFKSANKLLGGVIGIVKGGIFVIALSMLVNAAVSLALPGGELADACGNSRICAALNDFGIADLTDIELDFENILN